MNLLLLAPEFACSDKWRNAMVAAAPDVTIVEEGEVAAELINGALVDDPPPGRLQEYPNLRIILSLSAGVDILLADPTLPSDVPIVRLVNTEMAALMREYVVYHVLRIHRCFAQLEELQRESRWHWLSSSASARSCRVSVLGMGRLGRPAAEALRSLDFQVTGWSRTRKRIPGIRSVIGTDGLHSLLPETDILISILPLTPYTRGLLSKDLFRRLPVGASVINVGRGACLDEDDLLRSLDSGRLLHATLDVFNNEPLAEDYQLWRHPKVTITPHTAAYPVPESFIDHIAHELSRVPSKRSQHLVNRSRGY